MATKQEAGVLHTKDGALFVQTEPYGPVQYVGCIDLDDIAETGGGIDTLIRCFRVDGQGWDTISSTHTPPDPVTTTITELVRKNKSALERIRNCPAAFWVHSRDCGYANQFNNYVRSAMLPVAYIGDRTRSQRLMREEDQQAQNVYALSAFPPVYDLFKLISTRVSIAEVSALNAIAFADAVRCAGACGPAQGPCKIGFVAGDPLTGSAAATANVYYTDDYGATWTLTATDPFGAAEVVASLVVIPIDSDTNRVIAARGTTDAGNPAEIAYSDDNGATWTLVNVGSTNGQFAHGPHALFSLDYFHTWLATSDGYIYFSDDAGVTWVAQEEGVATTENLFWVHFANASVGYAGGAADDILKTVDGGFSWAAVTATGGGGDIISGFVLDTQRAWVGTDDGDIFLTQDGGGTWTEFSLGVTATAVRDLVFFTDMIGFALVEIAGPAGRILRTVNGGVTWENWGAPTNSGLNALAVCDENNAYAVGEANGGTAVIAKVLEQP
jgi:photosystem II stability/assembly factor-like uncharacterized protein